MYVLAVRRLVAAVRDGRLDRAFTLADCGLVEDNCMQVSHSKFFVTTTVLQDVSCLLFKGSLLGNAGAKQARGVPPPLPPPAHAHITHVYVHA
jgi:hypothetical protein